jgi:hemerythrin-like domain-containing protein
MKPTTLLERQHRNLQQLSEAVERGSVSMRESLLPQLAADLAAHIAVEDKLFYPVVSQTLHEDAWMRQGRARHAEARHYLERALDSAFDGPEFSAAMGGLRATIELHAEQDEEHLFPRFERALAPDAMKKLARAMMDLYHTVVERGYARAAVPGAPQSYDVAAY